MPLVFDINRQCLAMHPILMIRNILQSLLAQRDLKQNLNITIQFESILTLYFFYK